MSTFKLAKLGTKFANKYNLLSVGAVTIGEDNSAKLVQAMMALYNLTVYARKYLLMGQGVDQSDPAVIAAVNLINTYSTFDKALRKYYNPQTMKTIVPDENREWVLRMQSNFQYALQDIKRVVMALKILVPEQQQIIQDYFDTISQNISRIEAFTP